MYNMQPFMTFVSKYLQKCTSFYLLLLRNISQHCAHSENTTSFNVSSTLFSTPFVLFSCTPFGTKSYIMDKKLANLLADKFCQHLALSQIHKTSQTTKGHNQPINQSNKGHDPDPKPISWHRNKINQSPNINIPLKINQSTKSSQMAVQSIK